MTRLAAMGDIRDLYAAGQQQWPHVALTFDTFETHCLRILSESDPSESTRQYAGDLYLCCAGSTGNVLAASIIAREGADTVRRAIARINREPDFVEETVQEVWEKLIAGPEPRIAEYAGRGPLNAWLRVTAVHSALDSCRKRRVRDKRTQALDSAF